MFGNLTKNGRPKSLPPLRLSFSLGSIMVITVVAAFLGVVLSQMYRTMVEPTPKNVAYFALTAALGPSAILIVAGTFFKILRGIKRQQAAANNADLDSDLESNDE